MPPKKRGLSPAPGRMAARKPVRTNDSSKPTSARGNSKKATNIRSLSPTRNYSGIAPATRRKNSNVSDDSGGSGGPLWKMPRRGGSGPASKSQPKKFNSLPSKAPQPSKMETMKWQRNRARKVVIDISDSEDSDDSSIEIIVPPKPQSTKVMAKRRSSGRTTEKRKELPGRTKSMNDRRPAKTPNVEKRKALPPRTKSMDVSPAMEKRKKPPPRTKSMNDRKPASRSPTSATSGRGRAPMASVSPLKKPKRPPSKRGVTESPVIDNESPSKQKKVVTTTKFEKRKSSEMTKTQPVRPDSMEVDTTYPLPVLSPLVKERQEEARDRRQSTAVDGRAPVQERTRSPARRNLRGRRLASMPTEETHNVPPSRPSHPLPRRNAPAPPVPAKASFTSDGLSLSAPPAGQVDPRRQSTAVDGRSAVRSRSPTNKNMPGRRVASMVTEDVHHSTNRQPQQLSLSEGRPATGGRRVRSVAVDERPKRRSMTTDDIPTPRRRSTAMEEMPERTSVRDGRTNALRTGDSGPRSRTPPPRSKSGPGGGVHNSGRPRQMEFDSIHHMPANLQNKYGGQLGRFAASGGRGGGGARGGRNVFSGRVTFDGRKVQHAPVTSKPKVVIPMGGTPYSTAGRPAVPSAGRGDKRTSQGRSPPQSARTVTPTPTIPQSYRAATLQPQSVRSTTPPPTGPRAASDGRKKRRDSGGLPGNTPLHSPPNISKPLSRGSLGSESEPQHSPRKNNFTKKWTEDEPFMFPIDDPDIIRDIVHDIVQPGGSVRILICSANLGNAQPDDLSLNEWIPANGSMKNVLTTPRRYPVMLNFPSEEKTKDLVATDRAVYSSNRTRPSQLLTITEISEGDFSLEEESGILPTPSYIQLPSTEILIETVDEDDDDQSVILQDTLEVRRSIRVSDASATGSLESKQVFGETVESQIANSDEPSEIEEELDVGKPEEAEAVESEATAVPDKKESSPETDPIEELPEQTQPEVENVSPEEYVEGGMELQDDDSDDSEIKPPELRSDDSDGSLIKHPELRSDDSDGSLIKRPELRSDDSDGSLIRPPTQVAQKTDNGGAVDDPKRYTASTRKLDSIRQRIEDSIRKSKADGFAFGEDFHARQRSMLQSERLKNQEAKVRLHLGSMAPDQATSSVEKFVGQQTATKSEERKKARQARDMMSRGSLGVLGHNSKRFQNLPDLSAEENNSLSPPKTPPKTNAYLQAVPAQVHFASPTPEAEEPKEAEGSKQAELNSQNSTATSNAISPYEKDAGDVGNPEKNDAATSHSENAGPDEGVHAESSQNSRSEEGSYVKTPPENKSGDSSDTTLPSEQGANASKATGASKDKNPTNSVVQSSDKESGDIDNAKPSNIETDVGNKDFGRVDGGQVDASFAVNDNCGAQRDLTEILQNNLDMEEPQPHYEEGPDTRFEIIVIGMQEATFDPNEEDPDDKELPQSGSDRSTIDESDRSTIDASDRSTIDASDRYASDSDGEGGDEVFDEEDESDEEEDGEEDYCGGMNGRLTPTPGVSDDDDDVQESPNPISASEKDDLSPKRGKRLLQIAKKAGKKTIDVGKNTVEKGKKTVQKGKKTLKAAQKTSKAVKTLMSARNHTKRELPKEDASAPEDGAMSKWEDTDVLHFLFDRQLPSYERALSYQLGEMRLMVYYLKSSVELDVLSVKSKPTGKHNLANKGGIVTEVAVNRSTRLCFSSAHLEAHEGEKKFEKRRKSFERIFNAVNSSVTAINFDPTMASHYSFFMGDLNFRTKLPNFEAGSDEHIQASHALTALKKWDVLNRYDELSNALAEKKCLAGWKTPYCNFDPTFKVARQDGYKYNVLRSPSYTDRILYKAIDQLEDSVEISLYEPITHFTSSDHKPVRGAFEIQLTEKLDLKPRTPTKIKEKLHILFTSLELSLDSDKYKPKRKPKSEDEVLMPNPFVSFISTPRDALELDPSSRKKSTWRRFGLKKPFTKTKPDRSKSPVREAMSNPLSAQWPGSSVRERTFNPKWEAEEIHFEVGMKCKTNNRPLDLSGALMHISVFDGIDSNPKLLGSFTLNLASLIKLTKEANMNKRGSTRHARAMGMKAGKSNQRRLSKQPSSRLSSMIESLTDELGKDSRDSMKLRQLEITTLQFDEVLVDSGIQTGTIKCTVDAWWMQEDEQE